MVKLRDDEKINSKRELNDVLNDSHIDFVKWTDKYQTGINEYEYSGYDNISQMGKNSHGIWILTDSDDRIDDITLDQAYERYRKFASKCKPTNGYDIIINESTDDWIEDNEDN